MFICIQTFIYTDGSIGKAILVSLKPRLGVIYSFIFHVPAIKWMSSVSNK